MARCTKNPYLFALVPLLAACLTKPAPRDPRVLSPASHEQALREHEAMIEIIEDQCHWNRRDELTTGPGVPTSAAVDPDEPYTPCWKAADRRQLDAHENAAAWHRSALRKAQVSASR